MTKTFKNRGVVTFSVRKKHRDIWELFKREVEKDPNFNKLRYRNHTVLSIAIVNLAYKYLVEKGAIEDDTETSD